MHSSAPAVVRAAALLAILAEPGVESMGPSDLARRLDLPKSTVANLCSALEQVGFVRRVDRRYELGYRLLELGAAYSDRIDIIQEFKEASTRLRWASEETIQLAILEGAEITYLARHDGTQPVRLGAGARQLAEAIWHVLTKNEPFAPASPLSCWSLDDPLSNWAAGAASHATLSFKKKAIEK